MRNIIILLLVISSFAFGQFRAYKIHRNHERVYHAYQSESIALFARMDVQPDETRKQLIDGLISDLKTEGLWSSFDAFWMFAAHDQTAAPLNWIENDHNCSEVNSPVFEVDRGYTGGSPNYLTTGFNPSTAGGNFSLNSATIGVYSRTNSTGAFIDIGCYDFATFTTVGCRYSGTNTFRAGINSAGLSNFANANSQGLHVVSRVDDLDLVFYKNSESGISIANASSALTNEAFFVLASNIGSASNYTNRQIAFVFIGRGLTANEVSTLFNLIEAYLDAIGAGVVE